LHARNVLAHLIYHKRLHSKAKSLRSYVLAKRKKGQEI
jgi:hypothetical protein